MPESQKNFTARDVKQRIRSLGNEEFARGAARFFKTGPGGYSEGDIFVGLCAADMHKLAREFKTLPLGEVESLLQSEVHEDRGMALLILVLAVAKAEEAFKKQAYNLYLANIKWINNWDLVDCSAPHVVGAFLREKSRKPLHRLAKSNTLWERRIAIVSTQHFIRHDDFADTLKIAEMLLGDKEDLIHKAAGWMLREVGKRDTSTLETFLATHCRTMPRTMLRYSIERFPEAKRKAYLKGELGAG